MAGPLAFSGGPEGPGDVRDARHLDRIGLKCRYRHHVRVVQCDGEGVHLVAVGPGTSPGGIEHCCGTPGETGGI